MDNMTFFGEAEPKLKKRTVIEKDISDLATNLQDYRKSFRVKSRTSS